VQFDDIGGGSSWIVGLQSPTIGFNIQEVGVATRFVINEDSNVGIGTTSPTARLHAEADPNTPVGIRGESKELFGTGVYGLATRGGLVNYGVRGESSSTAGWGVYGESTAGATGVYGAAIGGNFSVGVDYSKLTPLLVEAVKALRLEKDMEIVALLAENEAMRAQLESLEQVVS